MFYEIMKSYLLTGQQLVENGYPQSTGTVGVASINWGRDPPPDIQPVGANGTIGEHVGLVCVLFVWSVCCVSCLSGLCTVCPVCLGCLSFFPTSYIASVLCTCISMCI